MYRRGILNGLMLVLFAHLFYTPSQAQLSFSKNIIDPNLRGAYWVYARDMDGDGDTDVIAASTGGALNWYRNNGDGRFGTVRVGHFRGAWGTFAEDVNGDGAIDVLGASASLHEIAWWENRGGQSFTQRTITGDFASAEAVFAADLDNDGDTDVVGTAWEADEIAWWEHNGRQQFSKHTLDRNFSGAHAVFVADLDGDGRLDIIGTSAVEVAWWQNQGGGRFRKALVNGREGALGVFVADLDGDGDPDVVTASRRSENIDWYENTGSGGFSRRTVAAGFGNSWTVAVGDADGDGDLDVASGGIFNHTVKLWENRGGGHFTEHVVDDRFRGVRAVYLADVDGDGVDDVVAVGREEDQVAWWKARGVAPSKTIALTQPDGGETWLVGSVKEIRWSSRGDIDEVSIDYSTDGGATWTSIVEGTENDGIFAWTVPDTPTSQARVRISDTGGDASDTSAEDFAIVQPFITVLSPNGGEGWAVGTQQDIRWQSSEDVTSVTIEYSPDGGENWSTLATAVPNTGAYPWSLPDDPTASGLIRITDTSGLLSDVSDAPFSLTLDYAQRVNAGGNAYHDGEHLWAGDQPYAPGSWGYEGGRTYRRNDSIANTSDDPLYQSERYGMAAYRFTVPFVGRYQVVLHLAEIYYTQRGARVFGVRLEGSPVLSDLDLFATAGHDVALTRTFETDVLDGVLDIAFIPGVDNPKVSAIEVTYLSSETEFEPDETPPVISDVTVEDVTTTTAQVTWITDEPADSQVEYGPQANLGQTTPAGGELVTSHSVTLTGLTANTTYHLRVKSTDAAGNQAVSEDYTFTTQPPDTAAPAIADLDIRDVTATSATVIWNTDEPATGQVEYGTDAGYGQTSVLEEALRTAHSHTLTGLTPGITYHLRARSTDAAGNLGLSADQAFTTTEVSDYQQRVNAGGPQYRDGAGEVWAADQPFSAGGWGYVGGSTYQRTDPISNTNDPTLYQTERYGMQAYRFTVPFSGTYRVELHLAEIFYRAPGRRVFSVWLEDQLVLSEVDLYATAGHDVAVVESHEVEVSDGALDIAFTATRDNPKVAAIAVRLISTNGEATPDTTAPVIAGLEVSKVTANSVAVRWTTDELADSQVEYAAEGGPGQTTGRDPTLVTTHEQTLTGLEPETTYRLRARSRDAAGNLGVSQEITFTTLGAEAYAVRLNAGGPKHVGSDGTTWRADQAYVPGGWGYVGGRTYERTDPIGNTEDDPLYQTERYRMDAYRFAVPKAGTYRVDLHFAEIFYRDAGRRVFNVDIENHRVVENLDLAASAGHDVATTRSFEVEVNDGILDINFTPVADNAKIAAIALRLIESAVDTTPPAITDVQLTGIGETRATVTWSTDEPADSQVQYGLDANYGEQTALDTDLVRDHSQTLSGLTAGTTYHLRVVSRDASRNLALGEDVVFTTAAPDTTPPQLLEITVTDVQPRSVTVRWRTDEPASGRIDYDPDDGGGLAARTEAVDTVHAVTLQGLTPATRYRYQIVVVDARGNETRSDEATFTTAPPDTTPPSIAEATIAEITATSAALTWTTDEASGSRVSYGLDSSYALTTTADSTLQTTHRAELVGLRPDTLYYARIHAWDAEGNRATTDLTFRTAKSTEFVRRVNAGGAAYQGVQKSWSADQPFSPGSWGYVGGQSYAREDDIRNTTDDALYQTERYGMAAYRFTVPKAGSYRVVLHFAEIFYRKPTARRFEVRLEDESVLQNLDLFQEVGHDVAAAYAFDVEVTDGVLDIQFIEDRDHAKVSAIEVLTAEAVAPKITAFSPETGPPGTEVVIEGKNFLSGGDVEVNGDRTYRIMPLGDSITQGHHGSSDEAGYRSDLAELLAFHGIDFNFVGTKRTGRGDFDRQHEGHSGWEVDEMLAEIERYLRLENPEIILLHLGTNDISHEQDPDSIIVEMEALPDVIHRYDSSIEVIVASLIPRTDHRNDETTEFNRLLSALYQTKKDAGYALHYAAMNETFKAQPHWQTELMSDPAHPNDPGYNLMARVWLDAILALVADPGLIVAFNGQRAGEVFVDSDSRIRAIVPQGASTGEITITTAEGEARSDAPFVVTDALAKTGRGTNLSAGSAIPETFALYPAYPNPFNATTRLVFDLPEEASVRLAIYNMLGQRVRVLVDETLPAGQHAVLWDSRNAAGAAVASGAYVYVLEAGPWRDAMRVTLLK